ncbi:MAG: hypothetical protein LBG07_07370 [Treponema sp.]|jgi:uncharacterized integral membrane protein|nr:hypothetical protein [Treponema sp.]
MPWRLIIFIIIAAAFLGFIGLNLENRCDVSLGFRVFSQVPVFLSTLSAFILGMVLALPLAMSFRSAARGKKRAETTLFAGKSSGKKKNKAGEFAAGDESPPSPGGDYGID